MLSLRPTPLADPGRWLYELLAPAYDRVSGEAMLYATARTRAIELLQLRPGTTVLDVACGTGRNHEHIQQRIGPAGRLVGADRSPRMLQQARERAAHHRWSNMKLVETDVTHLTLELLDEGGNAPPSAGFDAVLCTLGLTVISDWRSAWQAMLAWSVPVAESQSWTPDTPPNQAKPARRWRSDRSPGCCADSSPPIRGASPGSS
jgi:SAM-dependent methyltransferase